MRKGGGLPDEYRKRAPEVEPLVQTPQALANSARGFRRRVKEKLAMKKWAALEKAKP